ncbi:lipopolysaccharide assembly protein LapB [Erwinia sp. S38]|uniref:tetratricopeptide repeat protein n=1 Tax=Erwinia sp. S38 TaxID=2769338 RepID=UPI00190B22EB|nr:tetratricopeptide repeat protein [Erwinia sp. S38]MBK0004219.1 tetratricopeptide repeat protein [Erwinia sp. S38]
MTKTVEITNAIELRKKGFFEKSRNVLLSLISKGQDCGIIYLNIAWAYDNQGLEEEALGYYMKALNEPLSTDDYFESKFGLACTYRCLGEFNKAKLIFEELTIEYPSKIEIIPFFSLCLMSLGEKDSAFKMLLELLIKYPPTDAVSSYRKALTGYVNEI